MCLTECELIGSIAVLLYSFHSAIHRVLIDLQVEIDVGLALSVSRCVVTCVIVATQCSVLDQTEINCLLLSTPVFI